MPVVSGRGADQVERSTERDPPCTHYAIVWQLIQRAHQAADRGQVTQKKLDGRPTREVVHASPADIAIEVGCHYRSAPIITRVANDKLALELQDQLPQSILGVIGPLLADDR